MTGRVSRKLNEISFRGTFGLPQLRGATAALHALKGRGFEDITFDFRACDGAFAGSMSMLCALALDLRHRGQTTFIKPPSDSRVATFFSKTNWLHLLDPVNFPSVESTGATIRIDAPASQFQTDAEQRKCVERMINCILHTRNDISRKDLAAIEWCLAEVTGNVITHSHSSVGGITQLSNYRRSQRVELVVADVGISIPQTLRAAHAHILSDGQALEEAIKEGITRDKNEGMGNGLFGTFQLAAGTHKGYMHISSRYAHFGFNEQGEVLNETRVPIPGTLIVAAIGMSQPGAIHQALRFSSGIHEPIDFFEMLHNTEECDRIDIDMSEIESLYSRESARLLRMKVINLLRMLPGHRVAFHFVGIEIISSSFADECFGKLAKDITTKRFAERLVFEDTNAMIREVINHAIRQRMGVVPPDVAESPGG